MTLEEQAFNLEYYQSLLWLKIEHPTDEEMEMYPIIDMTSDIPWDPEESPGERIINPSVKKKVPPDLEELRKCLGWKPKEVIEKTLQATTQYVKNSLCNSTSRQGIEHYLSGDYTRQLQQTLSLHLSQPLMGRLVHKSMLES